MIVEPTTVQVHDLLRVRPDALEQAAPEWASRALQATPWVVVRRASAPAGAVAIGVRGARRDLRHGSLLRRSDIVEVLRPEDLARTPVPLTGLPALEALRDVAPRLDALGLRWGPVGAVGFELATGTPQVHPRSDLDLIVCVSRLPDVVEIGQLRLALAAPTVRVDCLLELPNGAVHLDDLRPGRQLLMRTARGPELRDGPL